MPKPSSRSIDALVSAAEGSLPIPAAMSVVAESMFALGARVSFWDQGRMVGVHSVGLSAACEAQYATHFASQDPWAAACAGLPVHRPATSDELVPRKQLEHSEFYDAMCRPNGIHDLCGAVVARTDDHDAIFGLVRARGARGDGRREVGEIGTLLPYLESLAVAERWRRLRATVEAVDTVPFGIFVIERASGAVVSVNVSGMRLVERGIVREHPGGIAVDGHPIDVRTAAERWSAVSTTVRGTRVVVHAGRATKRDHFVTVHVHDPRATAHERALRAVELFGLSPREAEVAESLLLRLSPKEIAHRHRVSLATVRTQLRSLLAKTSSDRLSTLLMCLSEL